MKLYEKHIFYVYLISFVKTLLFVSSIIVAIKTLDIAQSLTEESSVSISDIWLISLHISPYILYTITPFALTITSFSVFYKLLTHSEIITLQNSGLTNSQIVLPHMFVSIVCTILMLYSSAIIIPKTVQIRKNLQEAIIKRKIENFLTPNVVKEVKDITILTSQLDRDKKIALTLIHKPTQSGETLLIGNIRQSWEKNGMIGLITDNATILSINGDSQKILQFKTLETQINPFSEYKQQADLRHLTTPEILKMHFQNPQKEYIATINNRIMPSLAATLLPFAMASLIVKFYQNRSKYRISHIVIIAVTLLYILFSCYNLGHTFTSKYSIYFLYINITLTFVAIYLASKTHKKL